MYRAYRSPATFSTRSYGYNAPSALLQCMMLRPRVILLKFKEMLLLSMSIATQSAILDCSARRIGCYQNGCYYIIIPSPYHTPVRRAVQER
jgi:hypothetical protein